MTLNEYQRAALSTALRSGDEFKDLMHWALGISGESGEISEKLKKIIRDKNSILSDDDKTELLKEVGDVLWYLAVLVDQLGYDFDKVATDNVTKLRSRQQRGKLTGSGDNR